VGGYVDDAQAPDLQAREELVVVIALGCWEVHFV
jgi:hypothetical protein